jgi:hypothetical protein
MHISRDEAAQALSDINHARSRIDKLHDYSDASPFLILCPLAVVYPQPYFPQQIGHGQ